jgi:hypothetical protein
MLSRRWPDRRRLVCGTSHQPGADIEPGGRQEQRSDQTDPAKHDDRFEHFDLDPIPQEISRRQFNGNSHLRPHNTP